MKAQIKRPSKREREILSFVAKTNFAFFLLLSFSYKHVGGHAIVAVRGSLRRASIWKLLNRVVLQSSYLPIPCLCSASLSFFFPSSSSFSLIHLCLTVYISISCCCCSTRGYASMLHTQRHDSLE